MSANSSDGSMSIPLRLSSWTPSIESGRTQHDLVSPDAVPIEYTIPTKTKALYLFVWFALNIALTIYNKAVLIAFPFPWLLTAIQTGSVSLGCVMMAFTTKLELAKLETQKHLKLILFSILFTANIAFSNISLEAVSVPLHQTIRSMGPVFTVALYTLFFSRLYQASTYFSLIPLVLGVILASYGEYEATTAGFLLTVSGCVLSSLKSLVTNIFLTQTFSFSPQELLLRMSPLATLQCLSFSMATGEIGPVLEFIRAQKFTVGIAFGLALNGLLAFMINMASFETNRVAGALSLAVVGNIKQCLTILLGVLLFNVPIGLLNSTGMVLTLIGVCLYSRVELAAKR